MARSPSGHARQSSLFDANDAPNAGTDDDHLKLSREVQVIKRYLERSNDVNTAAASFRTLVQVTSAFDVESHFMAITHLLETIAVALDVVCNRCQGVDPSTRTDILEFVNKLDPFFSIEGPYFDFAFLLKRIQSAIAFSVECSQSSDTFGGLVFELASILLSHHKYDVRITSILANVAAFEMRRFSRRLPIGMVLLLANHQIVARTASRLFPRP
jgi:hypothetical protein